MRNTIAAASDIGARFARWKARRRASAWIKDGRTPGARGYGAAKWLAVERALGSGSGHPYGYDDAGLDERVVEYPWVFDRLATLRASGARLLDAGSVMNHPRLIEHCRRVGHVPLSIVTLRYEGYAHVSDDVRYEFADLRSLPYRDGWFSFIVSLSTLEHVGMDNTVYGDMEGASIDPSVEAGRAMRELGRVTTPGGRALLSVPFGTRSNRGWLRVFASEDLDGLTRSSGWQLEQARFFRATRGGWRECAMEDARTAGYNEHLNRDRAGIQTAPEWVAAAEAVALVELLKA